MIIKHGKHFFIEDRDSNLAYRGRIESPERLTIYEINIKEIDKFVGKPLSYFCILADIEEQFADEYIYTRVNNLVTIYKRNDITELLYDLF